MSGTHKKKMRAEKAKIKLKGAKLPKGLNVTKTDFKVRKITIRDQLKGTVAANEYGATIQSNLKETLTRLKHHSANIRLDAQRDLRGAIASAHPGIPSRLNDIMLAISSGVLDVEREPRRDSFKTLSSLLGALPSDAVAPFFHVVASHLCCAMTHVEPQLQEDALLMLDVCLQHVPQLIAANSERIFGHFLEMISRVRNEARVTSGGVARTLSANVGQRQTSVRWRAQVLQRLQRMFITLNEHNTHRNRNRLGAVSANNFRQAQQLNDVTRLHSLKETQYFPLLRGGRDMNSSIDLTSILSASLGWQTDGEIENSSFIGNGSKISAAERERATRQHYVRQLMPLLLEAWIEVRPNADTHTSKAGIECNTSAASLLNSDASETLHIVLQIIDLLWQLIEETKDDERKNIVLEWMCCEYGEEFANGFQPIGSFPYQQQHQNPDTERVHGNQHGSKRPLCKKAAAAANSDPKCLMQNLTLALLMGRFFAFKRTDLQRQAQRFNIIIPYMQTIVKDRASNINSAHSVNVDRLLAQCLRLYLLDRGLELVSWNAKEMRQLLRFTIETADKSSNQIKQDNNITNSSGLSGRLVHLICDIVEQPALLNAYYAEHFVPFLTNMPRLLLQPIISLSIITAMSTLAKQNNGIFLESLAKHCLPVLQHLSHLQVLHTVNAFEGKKQILNLFYWPLMSGHLQPLPLNQLEIVLQDMTDKRVAGYTKDIFH